MPVLPSMYNLVLGTSVNFSSSSEPSEKIFEPSRARATKEQKENQLRHFFEFCYGYFFKTLKLTKKIFKNAKIIACITLQIIVAH